MTKSRPRTFANALLNLVIGISLSAGAIAVSLGIGELSVRKFRPQTIPATYPQRFLIDGKPSFQEGYIVNDPILPRALKANYNHSVVDVGSYPKRFSVALDAYGYRNSRLNVSPASVVFVGDSSAFGYGVEAEESLPNQLALLLQENVYNLAIPGLGPESYMVMLERYLKRAAAPRLIVIGVHANDPGDLASASWKELADCQPPASRIYRGEFPAAAPAYPLLVSRSFLRSSHLASFLVHFATAREQLESWELAQMHQLAAGRATNVLKLLNPSAQDLEAGVKAAIHYATELARWNGLTDRERQLLGDYTAKMNQKNWRDAYPLGAEISASLIERDRNPISQSEVVNIVPQFHYSSVYYWKLMDERASGAIGDYDRLLNALRKDSSFKSVDRLCGQIQLKLRALDSTVEVEIREVNEQLARQFKNSIAEVPAECDKLTLFLRRMRMLADANGSKLLIVNIPSEFQLRYYRQDKVIGDGPVCSKAAEYPIPCFSLASNLVKHYGGAEDALYLDGSHFNRQGNRLAAQWIYEWIRVHELRSIDHAPTNRLIGRESEPIGEIHRGRMNGGIKQETENRSLA